MACVILSQCHCSHLIYLFTGVALKKDVFDSLTLAFSPLEVRGAINFLKNNGNIARERADEGTSYRFVNDTL